MSGPFLPADLEALGGLLDRAAVVAMEDVFDGATSPTQIGMRHDCDNVIHEAVQMAEWEADRGIRSTYYILHTAPYWSDKTLLRASLETIAGCGHEIGIHNNAVTVALQTGRDPADVLHEATDELRSYGYPIRSTVGHGDMLCHVVRYCNDEMFDTCARPGFGGFPDRTLEHEGQQVRLRPRPMSEYGFDFDSIWLRRGDYLSDSGGQWSQPFTDVVAGWPSSGQLHMLVHPDWWSQAFARLEVAA
jgi:hypothetical protein